MTPAGIDETFAQLRGNTRGDLQFAEHLRPLHYVIETSGLLVAPVMVAMLQADDPILHVPEAADGAIELQVTLASFDEHAPDPPEDCPLSGGALADRWRIHHGDPPDVNWALIHVEAAKHDGLIIDGEALRRPNPLTPLEPAICRRFNRDHPKDLRRALRHHRHIDLEAPVLVAVDPLGFDVRGQFEVHRLPAPAPMADEQAVDETFAALCAAAPE